MHTPHCVEHECSWHIVFGFGCQPLASEEGACDRDICLLFGTGAQDGVSMFSVQELRKSKPAKKDGEQSRERCLRCLLSSYQFGHVIGTRPVLEQVAA